MKKIFAHAVVLLLILALPGFAQEILKNEVTNSVAENQPEPGEQPNVDVALLSLGTVVRAEAGRLVVSEYEYETDMDQENTYLVNEATKYENVASVTELKPGDSVEIVYQESGADRIALAVTKEEDYVDSEEEDQVGEQGRDALVNEDINGMAP